MDKYIISALIGIIIGIWLIFFVKHIEFIVISALCVFALRYLLSEL